MNKTTNYELNQWEKTDRILMDDFNRDNTTIDAAIKAEADRVAGLPHGTLLCGGATEADVEQVNLDVSQVDWSQYLMAVVEVQGTKPLNVRLYINGSSDSGCLYAHVGSSASSSGGIAYLGSICSAYYVTIPVLYSGGHSFPAVNPTPDGTFGYCSKTLDSLTALTLEPNNSTTIPAGTVVRLWGVR